MFIDFLCLGVCVDCTFFCSGLCVYWFPLFGYMCLLFLFCLDVFIDFLFGCMCWLYFFCSGLCVYWFPVWVYVLIVLFSVQDYVFIDFLCLGVCLDCTFFCSGLCVYWFLCLGVCVDCTFFCLGLCVYWFPVWVYVLYFFLFRIMCLLISSVWVYVLIVLFSV